VKRKEADSGNTRFLPKPALLPRGRKSPTEKGAYTARLISCDGLGRFLMSEDRDVQQEKIEFFERE
jgi:hypothetical protein